MIFPLPLTSGMFTANVLASPLVNVKFLLPLSNEAVINELPVIADVTLPVIAFILVLNDALSAVYASWFTVLAIVASL